MKAEHIVIPLIIVFLNQLRALFFAYRATLSKVIPIVLKFKIGSFALQNLLFCVSKQ
ncbi:hypothetical protein HMPREF9296_2225 [Prevotella disiens FB035-09AN]|uniref:Uncharacterized protein n=1 Tax=Prevotella disiens FB035-09AN TaxID=866771 RepID=E1KR30_9BACT|nr:hypothetical protein HMPREF9296_2225 [Prevotella disiens FB035-09AN]